MYQYLSRNIKHTYTYLYLHGTTRYVLTYKSASKRFLFLFPYNEHTGGYYVIGVLCFGIARSRPLATSVLFPLDFTAAGGLSTTHGYVRVFYAIYLEGAVIIAAVAVAVVRVSATQSLTNIGLRYGLLTEA